MIERIKELNPEAIIYTGFDRAIIGVDSRECRVVYDQDLILAILQEDMSYVDALEYFEFNIVSMYVGENTPIILDRNI